ncbi:MAG: cysteine--tRNA ligase [Clostridia bacterium]|nr:cysteine--tRNA ligase [Clostridia bacterium]
MELTIYNTLDKKREIFVPINNVVRIYSCGPTVYKTAHIGNLRTYVFMDLLVRILRYDGFKVKNVMNVTDVGHLLSDADDGEDKMESSAKEQNRSPYEIADEITKQFFTDIDRLNITRPTICPKATDNIAEMIEVVKVLLEKGYAYEIDDGIYYDISKFAGYGKLSGMNIDDLESGARVEVNTQKRHPADFALWKKAQPNHIMQWDSPWGRGYPGWHIECTAMSIKYLGKLFDIHTGGVDHIPIHHENEIAQGEAYTGQKNTNYWMHSEFMLIDGGKMSKSLNNCYTVDDLISRGYSPLDFRYYCLNVQYRQKMNFTWEGLEANKVSRQRMIALVAQNKQSAEKTPADKFAEYTKEFEEAINDNLNVPMAMGVVWKLLKERKSADIYTLILKFDAVLGLSIEKEVNEYIENAEKAAQKDIPQEIVELAEQRVAAKKQKDYALADSLRKQIADKGYEVRDEAGGYRLVIVS